MKRTLALILACLMLIPLAACSKPEDGTSDTAPSSEATETAPPEAATPADEALAHLGERDFKGRDFHILHSTDCWEFYREDYTGELMNDEIVDRNRELEERYDITITAEKLVETDGSDGGNHALSSRIREESLAGIPSFQAFSDGSYFLIRLAQDGLCYNLLQMPNMDLSRPYWDQYSIETFTIYGNLSFVMGSLTLNNLANTAAIFFNREMAEDLGVPDLFEMVWNGTWTIDRMTEYCALATGDKDGNGKIEYDGDDTWGCIFNHLEVTSIFAFGLGYTYSHRGEDGSIVLDMMSERDLAACDSAFKLAPYSILAVNWLDYGINHMSGDASSIFNSGRALFLHQTVRGDMTNTACEYGILPQPKYDEAQENYITSSYHAGSGCVAVQIGRAHV